MPRTLPRGRSFIGGYIVKRTGRLWLTQRRGKPDWSSPNRTEEPDVETSFRTQHFRVIPDFTSLVDLPTGEEQDLRRDQFVPVQTWVECRARVSFPGMWRKYFHRDFFFLHKKIISFRFAFELTACRINRVIDNEKRGKQTNGKGTDHYR